MSGKHTDESWLHEKYVDEEMTMDEIAELSNVARGTIQYWMDKYDIERRSRVKHIKDQDRQYKDKEWMKQKYVEENRSANEIARLVGCDVDTVLNWLDRHSIERREREEVVRSHTAHFFTNQRGYEVIGDGDSQMTLHRLVAIAKFGVDAVADKVVHHDNEIPWDNRKENLQIMTQKEHGELHAQRRKNTTARGHNNV